VFVLRRYSARVGGVSIPVIPAQFRSLVDDAAIFPPGLSPLTNAVAAHVEHLRSPHRDLVGPFIVDAARLDALLALDPAHTAGLAVSVVVPEPSVVGAVGVRATAGGLDLAALEVKLDLSRPLAAQVGEIAEAAPSGVATYVEVPRPGHPEWADVLAAVAARGLMLKFRTGGTEAAAFPSESEVATWIVGAVGARTPFKCTAGLHHAIRHLGAETGFEHHGYLNVLLATARAHAGAHLTAVAVALAERSPERVADAVASDPGVPAARKWFTSYGSCSILEPLNDLEALDLITRIEGASA
jgi:hypothetical protein